uniref:Reverse transcriptase Ty1/copia-type domain-containing protein n=1 Tax=Fagus sylvatica TaxID=28930 RepID=A0A2N9FP96_FAGSY
MSEVPPKSSAAPPVSSTVMTQLDNMSMQMTSNKLDGTNYSAWSQFVELYVTGKGKLGYLTGEKIKPAISDPSFSTWVEENAMLMSWLLNSMTPDINASFLRLPTAHDIWDAVAQTYFTGNDASQIYELRRKAHETRQQGKSLASYFSALQTIWQELDFLNPYDMESAKDTATLKTRIENERVYDFLAGLDPGFDQIRVQVLAQDPTPNLRSTYAFVRREELRQAAMLASPPHESSALMTIQHSPSALVSSGSWKPEDKESLFCTHCKGTKHTRETCFKLNGYPDWFRKKGERLKSTQGVDLLTGTMIGLGRERDGLYYLDLNWHAKEDTGQVHQVVGGDLEHSLQGENLQSEEKSWNVLPTLELNSVPSSVPSSGPALDSREQASLDQSNDQLVVPVTGNPEIVSSLEPTTPVDSHVDDSNMPIALRKSTRTCPSIYRYPISNYVSSHRLSPSCKAFANQLSSVSIPKNLQEALNNPRWKAAMVEEMEALQKNSTWKLVELPKDKKTVGCKWVFTVKHKADGSSRKVQSEISGQRMLSFHGDLEEEVYMDFPPGFSTSSESGKVCRLRKSLYGLKQSPRAWFGRFTHSMRKYGYHQSQSDHTLFLKHSNEGKVTALIVYVDDIVVTGNDIMEMGKLKTYLAKEFEIKDLGTLRYFLGIEVARSKEGIFVSQRKYVLDLLVETGMLACKPIDTPIEQNHRLGEDVDDIPVDRERYQKLVGKLIYLSHTRPDIAFAVSVVSQFMHAPCEKHMEAVYRILRYLKSAPGKGLMLYKNGHLEVEGYTDADWAGSITDRRSTSGYCTFVGGNLVTWRSKKQSVVARSSAEAEFRAMAHGICEMLWLKAMLKELGVHSKDPMKLYCDNKAAISIAHNPVQHDRTKHVEVDRHFIKEKLTEGLICTPFVRTENQLADILTKGVSNKIFNSALDKLGIRDIYAPA